MASPPFISYTDAICIIFDVLVIGGGPAAMSAMVYLARQKRSFAVLTKEFGGEAAWASNKEHIPG